MFNVENFNFSAYFGYAKFIFLEGSDGDSVLINLLNEVKLVNSLVNANLKFAAIYGFCDVSQRVIFKGF